MSMALCMYVRKYDSSRLLIETSKTSEQSLEVTSIINGNSNRIANMTNADIMSHVKEQIGENQGFIDILSLYDES